MDSDQGLCLCCSLFPVYYSHLCQTLPPYVSPTMVPGTMQLTMLSVSKLLDKTFTVIYVRYLVTVMMKVAHKIGAREV